MGKTTVIAASDDPENDPGDPVVLDLVGIGADNLLDGVRRSPGDEVRPHPPAAIQRPPSIASADDFLTTKEVAGLLNVPKRTVDDWRYQRKGPPYYTFGRHVRYRPQEVHDWANCHSSRGQ